MRRQHLFLAITLAFVAGRADAADRYSLTVYSAAQPGAISVETLQNYGMQLPGYALVRDARQMELGYKKRLAKRLAGVEGEEAAPEEGGYLEREFGTGDVSADLKRS